MKDMGVLNELVKNQKIIFNKTYNEKMSLSLIEDLWLKNSINSLHWKCKSWEIVTVGLSISLHIWIKTFPRKYKRNILNAQHILHASRPWFIGKYYNCYCNPHLFWNISSRKNYFDSMFCSWLQWKINDSNYLDFARFRDVSRNQTLSVSGDKMFFNRSWTLSPAQTG